MAEWQGVLNGRLELCSVGLGLSPSNRQQRPQTRGPTRFPTCRGPWRQPRLEIAGKFRSGAEPDQPEALAFPRPGSGPTGAARMTACGWLQASASTRGRLEHCSSLDRCGPASTSIAGPWAYILRLVGSRPPWLNPCFRRGAMAERPSQFSSAPGARPVLAQFSGPGRAAPAGDRRARRTARPGQGRWARISASLRAFQMG